MSKERMQSILDEQKRQEEGRGANKLRYINKKVLEELQMPQYIAPEKDNFLFIIPPNNPTLFYNKEIWVHYDVGTNSSAVLCPNRMKGEACPICEYRKKLEREGADEDLIKSLRPSLRFVWCIVDSYDDASKEIGVQLYDSPPRHNDEVFRLAKDRRTGETVDVSDPEEGKELSFERKGKDMHTKYSGFKLEDRDPPVLEKAWLEQVPDDFEEVLQYYDYNEIKAEFDSEFGGAEPAKEETGGSERGSRGARPKRGSKEEPAKDVPEKEADETGDVGSRVRNRAEEYKKGRGDADKEEKADKPKQTRGRSSRGRGGSRSR